MANKNNKNMDPNAKDLASNAEKNLKKENSSNTSSHKASLKEKTEKMKAILQETEKNIAAREKAKASNQEAQAKNQDSQAEKNLSGTTNFTKKEASPHNLNSKEENKDNKEKHNTEELKAKTLSSAANTEKKEEKKEEKREAKKADLSSEQLKTILTPPQENKMAVKEVKDKNNLSAANGGNGGKGGNNNASATNQENANKPQTSKSVHVLLAIALALGGFAVYKMYEPSIFSDKSLQKAQPVYITEQKFNEYVQKTDQALKEAQHDIEILQIQYKVLQQQIDGSYSFTTSRLDRDKNLLVTSNFKFSGSEFKNILSYYVTYDRLAFILSDLNTSLVNNLSQGSEEEKRLAIQEANRAARTTFPSIMPSKSKEWLNKTVKEDGTVESTEGDNNELSQKALDLSPENNGNLPNDKALENNKDTDKEEGLNKEESSQVEKVEENTVLATANGKEISESTEVKTEVTEVNTEVSSEVNKDSNKDSNKDNNKEENLVNPEATSSEQENLAKENQAKTEAPTENAQREEGSQEKANNLLNPESSTSLAKEALTKADIEEIVNRALMSENFKTYIASLIANYAVANPGIDADQLTVELTAKLNDKLSNLKSELENRVSLSQADAQAREGKLATLTGELNNLKETLVAQQGNLANQESSTQKSLEQLEDQLRKVNAEKDQLKSEVVSTKESINNLEKDFEFALSLLQQTLATNILRDAEKQINQKVAPKEILKSLALAARTYPNAAFMAEIQKDEDKLLAFTNVGKEESPAQKDLAKAKELLAKLPSLDVLKQKEDKANILSESDNKAVSFLGKFVKVQKLNNGYIDAKGNQAILNKLEDNLTKAQSALQANKDFEYKVALKLLANDLNRYYNVEDKVVAQLLSTIKELEQYQLDYKVLKLSSLKYLETLLAPQPLQ